MSFERAYIACMRCYELAQLSIKKTKGLLRDNCTDEVIASTILKDDQIFFTRTEALKAIEKAGGEKPSIVCLKCDYSQPAVAQYLNKKIPSIKDALKSQPEEKAHGYRTSAKPEED